MEPVIPAEAVEAALRALLPDTEPEALKGGFWWGNVETILEAAAPYMLAEFEKQRKYAGLDAISELGSDEPAEQFRKARK